MESMFSSVICEITIIHSGIGSTIIHFKCTSSSFSSVVYEITIIDCSVVCHHLYSSSTTFIWIVCFIKSEITVKNFHVNCIVVNFNCTCPTSTVVVKERMFYCTVRTKPMNGTCPIGISRRPR